MRKPFIRVLVVVAGLAMAGVALHGQSTLPRGRDFGVGASASTDSTTIIFLYQISDAMTLVPQVGFFWRNYTNNAYPVSTSYPGTWWDVGLGFYYALFLFNSMSVQAGPAVEFAFENYQNNGSADHYQYYYVAFQLNVRFLAMITKSLGVFTTLGAYYYFQDNADQTTGADTSLSGIGIQSLSLGVAYYFK